MIKTIQNYSLLVSGVLVSSIASIISINGFALLFGGSALIFVLFSSFEISKIFLAVNIHRLTWNTPLLKIFSWAVMVLFLSISTVGVYSGLSSGFERTLAPTKDSRRKTELLISQRDLRERQVKTMQSRLTDIDSLSFSIQQRVTDEPARVRARAYSDLDSLSKQKTKTLNERIRVQTEIDSISREIQTLAATTDNDKIILLYTVADQTGVSVTTIGFWLSIFLSLAFDPVGIIIVQVGASVINRDSKKESESVKNGKVPTTTTTTGRSSLSPTPGAHRATGAAETPQKSIISHELGTSTIDKNYFDLIGSVPESLQAQFAQAVRQKNWKLADEILQPK